MSLLRRRTINKSSKMQQYAPTSRLVHKHMFSFFPVNNVLMYISLTVPRLTCEWIESDIILLSHIIRAGPNDKVGGGGGHHNFSGKKMFMKTQEKIMFWCIVGKKLCHFVIHSRPKTNACFSQYSQEMKWLLWLVEIADFLTFALGVINSVADTAKTQRLAPI